MSTPGTPKPRRKRIKQLSAGFAAVTSRRRKQNSSSSQVSTASNFFTPPSPFTRAINTVHPPATSGSTAPGIATDRVDLPRLVKRNQRFHQSNNGVSVKNTSVHADLLPLFLKDWFHVILRLPLYKSVAALLITWTAIILIFGGLYVAVDTANEKIDCGLGEPGVPITWAAAFAFSLETCTTVGYGLPGSTNAFFEANCPSVQILIYAQMTYSMLYNAFLFAFFFAALAKCELRSFQLIFSDKLVIRKLPGTDRIVLKAQCYDMDSGHPIIETHVRVYALSSKDMKMVPLRLISPNDDLGAAMFTSLPVQVTHHIDSHSICSPRSDPLVADPQGLVLRSVDAATANREDIVCPVCGESYGTYERLRQHVNYNRIVEEKEDYPKETSHRGFKVPKIKPLTMAEVQKYMRENIAEIVFMVEGIDPQVSGTFQALQSYKYDDIVWDAEFEPCLFVEDNHFKVDLRKFHAVKLSDDTVVEPHTRVTSAEGVTRAANVKRSHSFSSVPVKSANDDDQEDTIIFRNNSSKLTLEAVKRKLNTIESESFAQTNNSESANGSRNGHDNLNHGVERPTMPSLAPRMAEIESNDDEDLNKV